MSREVAKSRAHRCAIYTRKSSEEGLEQDFISLDAQREACEAYILSQKHEGWDLLPDHYDDGGISGGTMERPALRQILADIEASHIDVVVVYKVDRLTRSLSDFARIVDVFDQHDVSFVSVTQQFNTTSSIGRLTLNVLLSFAQFEREVTGERIRDKIAASKKKGMWMGGFVPLGYDAKARSLIINDEEANTIRTIFRLYLEKQNVRIVQEQLEHLSLKTKCSVTRKGKAIGGNSFSRGHIYKILSNPLYIGEIVHKGTRYPGQHAPIIDADTWDQVQKTLRSNVQGTRRQHNAKAPSLLAGLLSDDMGRKYSSSHAVSGGKRYRYYVASGNGATASRIPAHEIEAAVKNALSGFLTDSRGLLEKLGLEQTGPDQLKILFEAAFKLARTVQSGTEIDRQKIFYDLIERVIISRETLQVKLHRERLMEQLAWPKKACGSQEASVSEQPIMMECPVGFTRRGTETKLVIKGEYMEGQPRLDTALLKAVARGHVWFEDLASGRYASVRELCDNEKVDESTVAKFLRLAFLSPEIVRRILEGDQPPALTRHKLITWGSWPMSWEDQFQMIS